MNFPGRFRLLVWTVACAGLAWGLVFESVAARGAEFQAGAVVVDVTPTEFPVFVNGSMVS